MEKLCKDCKNIKPISEFVKNKNCKDGYENMCKACKNKRRQKRYETYYKNLSPLASGTKICKKCNQEKDISSFPIDLKCVDGRRHICTTCTNQRVSKRYHRNKKEFNSIFWNRKADSINKRVNGTAASGISGLQLEEIYRAQNNKCTYCKTEINKSFHVEHKIPLSLGGKHLVQNICFSCEDCNRLKHTRTDYEFKVFLQEYIRRFI